MSANFFSLPIELRNKVYEELLVLQEPVACPIQPWLSQSQLRDLTPGLLRVNKTVHLEASSILYARNRFDFTMCTSEDVISFLEQIGHNNASYILYICVDFPKFHSLGLYVVTLEDDSVCILEKIQAHCTKLRTLTTSLHSTNAMEVELDALDHPKIVAKALALVNACLRVISSLQEIIVEVYEDGPSDYIRREMKNQGWTISATEYVEELDFGGSFSDIDDDDHHYDYDDDHHYDYDDDHHYDYDYDHHYNYDYDHDGDDYDIDNDSDFWRRAGD